MIDILPKIVKTDVTCVKSYHNCILAAVGNTVQVFTKAGQQLQIFKVFDGQKVHGIIPNKSNKLAFFGGNQLKIFEFDFLVTLITKEISSRQCDDWIFDLQWVDSSMSVATVFAHNFISLLNVSNLSLATRVGCKQKCILYSAKLINDTWRNLYVFSGTVFGQILIWNPASADCNFADVLYRLEGHDGAIFSIDYSSIDKCIATTSDDRTVRIWQTSEDIFSDNTTKPNSSITLKHTLYGHTARIFKCKIVSKLIVTAGEDSFVHIWDLNGKLVRKFETHQGGCVWALDLCDSESHEYIFTGGGDSGVSMYPKNLKHKVDLLEIPDTPKILRLTGTGNVVVLTTDGVLKYFNKLLKKLDFVGFYENFKSYAIMEICHSRDLIALAGFNGAIYIYKEQSNDKIELICDCKPDGNRIFSLHWLSSSMFLTSTINGIMNCWIVQNKDEQYTLVKMHYKYILPECKERWATCASLCDNSKLVVGDRKGNIHLYESDKMESIHTIKKAHCHLGVTHLNYNQEQLYSLGRNGLLNKYYLNEKNLRQVVSDKLPFSWIASMKTIDDNIFLSGFSGSNFILYNLNHRRIILEVFCGGGHRSWDCMVTKSKLFYFDFIKDKQVHAYSEKWSNLSKSNIIDGYHTKEINCAFIVKFKNKLLVLSGGEDTTIRLGLVNEEKYKFNTLQTIKSHLSSVRCITHCLIQKDNREHTYFVFSGGGRAQIIFQKLFLDLVHDKIDCQQIYSYYKSNDSDSETRIMDLVTISLDFDVLLIAGCSDGTLKCFKINKDTLSFDFYTEISYKCKCIIRLSHINICGKHIIISMATDGKLVFWDFDKICSKIQSNEQPIIVPFFELKTHQSGINSFDYQQISDTKYILASGGDDNAICITAINFNPDNEQMIDVLKQIKITDIHAAQITGIFFTEKYLISTSIDQNISVFIYEVQENNLQCTLLKQYTSSISDIQGMKCIKDNELLIMVYGKGVEICSIFESNDSEPKLHHIPLSFNFPRNICSFFVYK